MKDPLSNSLEDIELAAQAPPRRKARLPAAALAVIVAACLLALAHWARSYAQTAVVAEAPLAVSAAANLVLLTPLFD